MGVQTFDVEEKRKLINVFKVGKLWVFKHFFDDNKELFRQLADHYNRETYRFEFKSVREMAKKLAEFKPPQTIESYKQAYEAQGGNFETFTAGFGKQMKYLKLLERNGFDAYLIEDLKGYVVKLDKFRKYAPVLRNSVAFTETAKEGIFLMKDLAAVEEAIQFGAEIYEGCTVF